MNKDRHASGVTSNSKLYSGEFDQDELEHLVASNLSRLRALRGLSVEELAKLSGASRTTISHIESGIATPSIRVLHRIATALEVSESTLLRDFGLTGMEILPVHASERSVSVDGTFVSRPLFPTQRRPRFEFHEIKLQPMASEHIHARLPGTCKNLVVTTGILEVEARGKKSLLGPGDAIFFDADQEHHYHNPGKTDGLAYVVTHHSETRNI